MTQHTPNRSWTLLFLAILAIALFCLDIMLGSVAIPFREVFRIVTTGESDNQAWLFIIEKIRLPKAITAILAGCGLSVSGLQMQTLFRNPLAGPSELGITAGAGLGVAAVMLAGGGSASMYAISQLGISGSWLIIGMASLGSAGVLALILLIAGRIRDNVILLIVGVMIGTITLSIISIWQYFSQPEQLQEYIMWTFGSLGGVTGYHLYVLSGVVTGGLLLAFASSKSLNALLLGENYARSMGLTVGRTRLLIMLSTSLLTGSITAFCGPIGFVGIAIPHITRSLLATSNHRVLIPATCLTGTVLLLLCDIIAQLPGSQTVIPINVVTSLLGAPVVIWIIIRRNNLRSSFS
ncbi:iron complex transport system permease protein [Dyadobacter sp. BE34]|uniref:Iron complex transport system permease protein n=1 Tax=Dyadobacter fermentans TaxID=94254 RepID=A0ABU1R832_9BACT|nr:MULTISPECIES: iron ABC transporter permease [Dyadobacter]MDR6809564.1 iron complex transport system permease protein [Dyadobacter fermentans]MDR7047179.1 iron complex transport system permease protein [Dyadobacter sp. BE242]MDR7201415.1 iron complex transport system permease protein [Dyadobacter sp. BE34]MDR7219285.1 iron complex transport system permease protein [Dyadobacter sp. BE31]MDR7267051.1 iron complex transport system permease protein [Dyadobacter sp. BE32]